MPVTTCHENYVCKMFIDTRRKRIVIRLTAFGGSHGRKAAAVQPASQLRLACGQPKHPAQHYMFAVSILVR